MQHKAGFTLIEILTAIVIVTILVVMAMPLYEKTVERSRLAEARAVLIKLQDAKWQAMDSMQCYTYDPTATKCPRIKHLNMAFSATANNFDFQTKDFAYSLRVSSPYQNAVCAKRSGGDYAGTQFLYRGAQDDVAAEFLCNGAHCADYGFESSSFSCTFS